MTATVEEHRIAERVQAALGPLPVLLCGSRALGTHVEDSDYDVVVVMPAARIPWCVRTLAPLAASLEQEIGSPVSVNPLPSRRLRREGSLYSWKLRREARVLAAPGGFSLDDAGPAPMTTATAFSYLACAAVTLLAPLHPQALADRRLPRHVQRAAHKCLLHVAQLRLLRRRTYVPDLRSAVDALDDDRLRMLSVATAIPEGLVGIRDELLADLDPVLGVGHRGSLVPNARYAALSALHGRVRARQALAREPVDRSLARAAAALLRAVRLEGTTDDAWTAWAAGELPRGLVPRHATWEIVHDTVVAEWPHAHPLGAL